MKKIILFGSGVVGANALEFLKEENIYAFCDNGCNQRGYKYGLPYITFQECMEIHHQYILIISANEYNSHEIINQLLDNEVDDFLVFDENMTEEITTLGAEKYVIMINNDNERYKRERNQFIRFKQNIEKHFQYLQQLTDIKKLRPAVGYLAYVQRNVAKFASEVFVFLRELKLKPFVSAGTALGLYRHGGYIPWDDDVDFGLMRDDYIKLLQFGKENFYFLEVYAFLNMEDDIKLETLYRQHPNEYIMVVSPNCMQIKRGTSEIDACTVDFFVYDFYDNNYEFNEHKKEIQNYKQLRYTERGNNKFIEIINQKQYIKSSSNFIYFGLDNMSSYLNFNDNWIPRDVIFPLKQIEFEGIKCFAPREIEKFIMFFYKDYNAFPNNISCHHVSPKKLKRDYIYCGIIANNIQDLPLFKTIYNALRVNGIYCVFILKRKYLNPGENYIEIENILIKMEVEYLDYVDSRLDFLLLSRECYENNTYDIPSILIENLSSDNFINFINSLDLNSTKKSMTYIKLI